MGLCRNIVVTIVACRDMCHDSCCDASWPMSRPMFPLISGACERPEKTCVHTFSVSLCALLTLASWPGGGGCWRRIFIIIKCNQRATCAQSTGGGLLANRWSSATRFSPRGRTGGKKNLGGTNFRARRLLFHARRFWNPCAAAQPRRLEGTLIGPDSWRIATCLHLCYCFIPTFLMKSSWIGGLRWQGEEWVKKGQKPDDVICGRPLNYRPNKFKCSCKTILQ